MSVLTCEAYAGLRRTIQKCSTRTSGGVDRKHQRKAPTRGLQTAQGSCSRVRSYDTEITRYANESELSVSDVRERKTVRLT